MALVLHQVTFLAKLTAGLEFFTSFLVIFKILPHICKNKTGLFPNKIVAVHLILFYNSIFLRFLSTIIFTILPAEVRDRFLLYLQAIPESLFVDSVISMLFTTILITKTSSFNQHLWIISLSVSFGLVLFYVIIVAFLWESFGDKSLVINFSLFLGIFSTVVIYVFSAILYNISKKRFISAQTTPSQNIIWFIKFLLFVSLNVSVTADINYAIYFFQVEADVQVFGDALSRLLACVCFLVVEPGSWMEQIIFTGLNPSVAQGRGAASDVYPFTEAPDKNGRCCHHHYQIPYALQNWDNDSDMKF